MSALDKIVREAREHGVDEKAIRWDEVDRRLFERIAEERRDNRARFAPRAGRAWPGVVFAAAAAAVIFAIGMRDRQAREPEREASGDGIAGTVLAIDGKGEIRVGGVAVAPGTVLHVGDAIETHGAQATIEHAGKVTWRVEADSRVTVTHTEGALVVALAEGAIEAQVVPVANGEAFAIDVDAARVAVHGTHLRVARRGPQVVVDLNEGVVSVGQAPRKGSLLGTLMTAPGHAEFVAADAVDTLVITHDPSAVRPATVLASASQHDSSLRSLPRSAAAKPESTNVAHTVAAPVGASHPEARGGSAEATDASSPDSNPKETLSSAVRACMAERPRAENVTVVVRTTLHLDLADDGSVRAARFDPPVAPDVNSCAAPAIYKMHFAHGGNETVAIDFEN